MTCIVAVRAGRRVYLGGDSCVSYGANRTVCAQPKVWRSGAWGVGFCGSAPWESLLRYRVKWPEREPITGERWVLADLPAEIVQAARELGHEELPVGSALLACAGRLYWLNSGTTEDTDERQDWPSAVPITTSYAADGTGEEIALGALEVTGKLAPRLRVMRALQAAAKHRPDVCGPYTVIEV